MDGSREVSNAAKPRSASKSSEKRGCMRGRRASERSVAFVSGRGIAPTKLTLKSKTKIHRANIAKTIAESRPKSEDRRRLAFSNPRIYNHSANYYSPAHEFCDSAVFG